MIRHDTLLRKLFHYQWISKPRASGDDPRLSKTPVTVTV